MDASSGRTSPRHESRRLLTTLRRCAALGSLALVGFAGIAPVHAAIPASERQVLIDLYNSTDGANWTANTGWLGPPGTECTWFQITCDAAQTHVGKIGLAGNGLVGTLPSLSELTNLAVFFVRYNQLTGPIPSLTGLTSLHVFDVYNNQLTGPIPSLTGLTNLTLFYVDQNQLTGPIPSLAGLTSLKSFMVYDNQLTGPIPSLAGLTSLEYFYVHNNQLTGPIPSLAGLTNLKGFSVRNNQLRGDAPDVPNPNALTAGQSSLCPNALNPTPNADWDAATGQTPWYQDCFELPDLIFSDGFDGQGGLRYLPTTVHRPAADEV